MARAEDDELRPRGSSRGRPRSRPPTSVAEMYAQPTASSEQIAARPQRSSKMKMASLMAVVDENDVGPEENQKNKRVKTDGWEERSVPMSISSLTARNEPVGPGPVSGTGTRFSLTDETRPAPNASSLFQEVPNMIQSFADERRREGSNRKNGVAANGDTSPPATAKSVYEFYFPTMKADTTGTSSGRSLKRKRRSGRRGDDHGASDLDLLRFGVDAANLVPQGLVDRVDVHMSRAVLVRVVGNHVASWCNRAGFAPSFDQELTTVLATYYPCGYPTLLDEVLAGFLFRRPEFIDLLLPPMLEKMLEKMQKAGESASTTKYPVANALARMCGALPSRTAPQAVACHDLACRTLLRCLLEHNREKFVLSPWISACVVETSGSVLHNLWRVLLPYRAPVQDANDAKMSLDDNDVNWSIEDPTQQIVELLAEEDKQRTCRFSCGFVELLLSDTDLKKHLEESQSFLIADCMERAFAHANSSWSASLFDDWVQRHRGEKSDNSALAKVFQDLLAFLVRFNSKLTVKKSDWFCKHVLGFILSHRCHIAEQELVLRIILQDYMSFVLGGTSGQILGEKGKQNGSGGSYGPTWEDLEVVGSQSVLDVKSKMELLFGLLDTSDTRSSALLVDIWSEVWSDKTNLPWGCVHGLLCLTIQRLEGRRQDRSDLGQKLQKLTAHVSSSYYRWLSRASKNESQDDVAVKFSEALSLLLPSTHPFAGILLEEVVGALANFEQKCPGDACTIFGNAVTQYLGSYGDDGMDFSEKRSVVQKSLVDYNCFPSTSAASIMGQLLTALKALASIKGSTGDFVRRVLSARTVTRLLTGLLNRGRRRGRQEILLDVMNVIVTRNTPVKNKDWARQHVVQDIVYCAYTGSPSTSKKAVLLLQSIFRYRANGVGALLWVILQQCTELCCGRENMDNISNAILPIDNFQGRADTFAELLKAMLITVPANTVREVLSFVEQKIASCSVGKTQMNMFLLLLLRKLVVCEFQCSVLLPVVQLAVCPLASSDVDQVRLIQLQLLKALCSRLTTVRHRYTMSEHTKGIFDANDDWKHCEDLICSEQLQADLQSIVATTPLVYNGVFCRVEQTNRASQVLAQGILVFSHKLKQQGFIDDDDEEQRILKKEE